LTVDGLQVTANNTSVPALSIAAGKLIYTAPTAGTTASFTFRLKDDGGTVFLFIGGGAQRPWLEAQARERGLSNVRFMPYQPRERLAESLSVPDVHLISLLPEVEGFVVPSKFYGIAAAGRPSIFVGSTEGEIAGLINEFKCGTVVRTGDVEGLSAAIARFRDDSALRQEYGRNARTIFEQKFDKHIALAAWSAVL